MACCTGEKIPWEEINDPKLKSMRDSLVDYYGGKLGLGAAPYGGEIAASVNPASNAALNMVMGMMGHGGYSPPEGFTYQGGQQGSPAPVPPPPGTPPVGDPNRTGWGGVIIDRRDTDPWPPPYMRDYDAYDPVRADRDKYWSRG